MPSLFSSHSRNKKHLCSCSGWNFFKHFPGLSLVRLSHNVYFDHPRTWKSLFPFQIFEYPLFIFFVLSACISSLKVLTSYFATLVFLGPVFFQCWPFLFYPQMSEQSLIASLTPVHHPNFSFTVNLSSMIL